MKQSKKEEYKIRKINRINERDIYEIVIEDCKRYITKDKPYIILQIHNEFRLFNLTEDDDNIPEDILKNIRTELLTSDKEELLGKPILKLTTDEKKEKTNILLAIRKDPNVSYLLSYELKCPYLINLEKAKQNLDVFNHNLHEKCNKYTMELDYVYKTEENSKIETLGGKPKAIDLLLCLFNKQKHCVSSLTIEIDTYDKILTIDSATADEYQNKKLNTILRSVIILLTKDLSNDIKYVVSRATNPVSVYTMVNKFNAIQFMDEEQLIIDTSSIDVIQKYMEHENLTAFESRIELYDTNIKNAFTIFDETIQNPIICENKTQTRGGKQKTRSKRNLKSKRKTRNKRKSKLNPGR